MLIVHLCAIEAWRIRMATKSNAELNKELVQEFIKGYEYSEKLIEKFFQQSVGGSAIYAYCKGASISSDVTDWTFNSTLDDPRLLTYKELKDVAEKVEVKKEHFVRNSNPCNQSELRELNEIKSKSTDTLESLMMHNGLYSDDDVPLGRDDLKWDGSKEWARKMAKQVTKVRNHPMHQNSFLIWVDKECGFEIEKFTKYQRVENQDAPKTQSNYQRGKKQDASTTPTQFDLMEQKVFALQLTHLINTYKKQQGYDPNFRNNLMGVRKKIGYLRLLAITLENDDNKENMIKICNKIENGGISPKFIDGIIEYVETKQNSTQSWTTLQQMSQADDITKITVWARMPTKIKNIIAVKEGTFSDQQISDKRVSLLDRVMGDNGLDQKVLYKKVLYKKVLY